MASLLTHMLEGDSLARLEQFASASGTPQDRALAQLGKNLIIGGQVQRLEGEMALHTANMVLADAQTERRATERLLDEAAWHADAPRREAQERHDNEVRAAASRDRAERAANPVKLTDFDLNSDSGVEKFFNSF